MTADQKRAIEEEVVRRCQAWLRARDAQDCRACCDSALDRAADELSVEVLPGSEVIA